MTSYDEIKFAHEGIGKTLAQNRLAVPINQREYAWETEHVRELFDDLSQAITKGPYFLGTIVLTGGKGTTQMVADGQQRLATITMLLAAMRNFLITIDDEEAAKAIEQEYLLKQDLRTRRLLPQLSLNVDDNDFFFNLVVQRPQPEQIDREQTESNKRISAAFKVAETFVQQLVATLGTHSAKAARLIEWVEYLRDGAQLIRLNVPDFLDAFIMFETLNDRGVHASQADLIKNHVLSLIDEERRPEGQQYWARMLGTLDAIGRREIVIVFLRHFSMGRHGPMKTNELFAKIKEEVTSESRALAFLTDVAQAATLYAALFNADQDAFWNKYKRVTRGHARTLYELQVEQIRPLLLAVMTKFEGKLLEAAFEVFVSWTVRFLVAGGGRGGLLDRSYAERAREVMNGKLTTWQQILKAMEDRIPTDAEFEATFRVARVSKSFIATYYLSRLEEKLRENAGAPPDQSPNREVVNLEHVLSITPHPDEQIDPAFRVAYVNRIGNLALLNAKKNVDIGNLPFSEKRETLAECTLLLTREIGEKQEWGPSEIDARQVRLAKLAVLAWPLTAGNA